MEQVFDIDVQRQEEFQKDILEPIILFIISGISSGFLQSIGKGLWNSMKRRIAEIVTKKRESGVSDLEFQVKDEEKIIRFRLHSDDPGIVEKAIDQFPKALESAEKTDYETDYYEFNNKKKTWSR